MTYTTFRLRAALVSQLSIVLISGSLSLAQGKGGGKIEPVLNPAEGAWTQIANRASPSNQQTDAVDWARLAADAREFGIKFPDHAQRRTAEKIALVASIRAEDGQPNLGAATEQATNAYLSDPNNPVRDRLELKIAFDQAGLRRNEYASRKDRFLRHAEHAEALIRTFPNQPEGYGYKLSLAKGESPERARRMAGELLASDAPSAIKQGARRVLDRLALVGQPLRFLGAEKLVKAANGRPIVVYSWTEASVGVREVVKHLAATENADFVGINLDGDSGSARASARALPGTQFYDGGGLDGPLARALQLTMRSSLYLVDRNGLVVEVDGHRDTESKFMAVRVPAEVRR